MSEVKILFDGGAKESNPGIGYGSFMVWVNGEPIAHIPPTIYSNNMNNVEAEYVTLVRAITWVCERFNEEKVDLVIEGDCELVRKQVGEMYKTLNGNVSWKAWKSNHAYLIKYRDTIRSVLPFFNSVSYKYMNEKLVKQILGH